ncbi:DUF3240 family protein [Thalassotalea piscium]
MSNDVIFTLNMPKDFHDEVIDLLMEFPNISGFNLRPMSGYSKEHSGYDIAEQVEGYRAFYQIEVLISMADLVELKAVLAPVCQPAKLKYWLTPVLASGHF